MVSLATLENDARRDLERLCFPAKNWVPPRAGPDGAPVLDVLIAGAGMCGQTAAFALMREGIRNFRIVDRSEPGREGPWTTFARMDILRSPKHLTGPDLGVPSLTFRAWYEAQFGTAAWDALHKIPRLQWAEYLAWVRKVLDLPVENRTELKELRLEGELVRAVLAGARGEDIVYAHKVVLALGREGSGAVRWPVFASFDPTSHPSRARVFHSADEFDPAAFAGKRIGVLGAGSSAFDNAAAALEAGAPQVVMFARRPVLPQVNKSKWTAFSGFQRGYFALDDARRWRFYTYIFNEQVPPPYESILRCEKHPGFSLRFGEPWSDLAPDESGVDVATPLGRHRFDAVVVATGFGVDMMSRPEIADLRAHAAVWADRITPEQARTDPEAARFPYLGDGFQMVERSPGAAPGLRNVHVYNWGATMSHGALTGDIPGVAIGANRLVEVIARDLFVADADRHFEVLQAHNEDELKPTGYFVPLEKR